MKYNPSKLTIEEMEKLSTKRLLAYKKKWNRPSYYMERDEFDSTCDCGSCRDRAKRLEYLEEIKSVLAKREHVE